MDFGGWQGGSLIGGVIQLVCSSWAKKNAYFETEKYGAVQGFARMYRHLKVVVSLCVGWGFVCGWVLSLWGL